LRRRLIEQNLFAPEGAGEGPFTLHLAITGNRLMFDIRREDGAGRRAFAVADTVPADREGLFHDLRQLLPAIRTATTDKIEAIDIPPRHP
jgi:uncharacterized protein (UPF0262 family)